MAIVKRSQAGAAVQAFLDFENSTHVDVDDLGDGTCEVVGTGPALPPIVRAIRRGGGARAGRKASGGVKNAGKAKKRARKRGNG
jgi:hypothetical protein